MANTYTSSVKLAMPAAGDRTWNVPVNYNAQVLDALAPVGALAVTTTEVPSANLSVAVAAGSYLQQDGTVATYAGQSSVAITATSTLVLYLDLTASGALTLAASYPSTAHVRLATVASTSSAISSITDNRLAFSVVGSWLDGTNITLGTASGTKIGTATNQKLAFYGATPVVQPTVGAATAGGTYTGTEQAMLQAVHDAVRALGLGS